MNGHVHKSDEEILGDTKNLECTCYVTDCKWRGKCKECIALHRYYGKTPSCLNGSLNLKEE